MPNIELLEKATPVAPIRIAALAGCQDLAKEVDKKLVKFRKEAQIVYYSLADDHVKEIIDKGFEHLWQK